MEESRVTLEDLTAVRKRLQIEVPADAVQAEIERVFQRVGQQARLRGFRPGKAPRHVLERMFGDEVRREVLNRLVEESFHHAVEAHHLAVVSHPEIDADLPAPGAVLRYSATVEVRPSITLVDLAGIEVVRPASAVTEEEVERVVAAVRESVAQLHPVDGRHTVESGDVVTVDVVSRFDGGEPVRREGVLLEAGGGSFPLALERQLVGHPRGAHLSLGVTYPADYANAGLAGKSTQFEVEIKDLRVKELPPLDDDFARDHGRCESLGALRARIRTDLEQTARARAEDAVRDAVLEQALGRHSFEVPPTLVERRSEALLGSLDVKLPKGADRERALAEIRTQVRPRAEQQVRAELLLDAIAEHGGVTVSDAEIEVEIEAIAGRERERVERVRGLYARPEARAALKAKLVRDRALAGVVALARIMPASVSESVAHEK